MCAGKLNATVKENDMTQRYSLKQVDSMRRMVADIYGPTVNAEERLRTYILAGITHDELRSAHSASEEARQRERENAAITIGARVSGTALPYQLFR